MFGKNSSIIAVKQKPHLFDMSGENTPFMWGIIPIYMGEKSHLSGEKTLL